MAISSTIMFQVGCPLKETRFRERIISVTMSYLVWMSSIRATFRDGTMCSIFL